MSSSKRIQMFVVYGVLFTMLYIFGFTSLLGQAKKRQDNQVQDEAQKQRPWEKYLSGRPLKIEYPDIKRTVLKNGISVYHLPSDIIPKTSIVISFEGGLIEEPENKTGLTSLWGETIAYSGSEKYDRDTLSGKLEEHASNFSFSNNMERAFFNLTSLSPFFEADLKMVLEVLSNPRFNSDDISLLKKQTIQGIKKRKEKPATLAHLGASETYWKGHPRNRITTIQSVSSIEREDLTSWHKKMRPLSRVTILLSGSLSLERLRPILEHHLTKPASRNEAQGPEEGGGDNFLSKLELKKDILAEKYQKAYHIIKDIPQSAILWKGKGVAHHSKDYYALKVFNFILGGDSFNSVLLQEIRVKRGWAYSIYSAHSTDKYQGNITIFTQSRNENVPSVIEVVEDLLSTPEAYITENRIKQAKQSIQNKFVFLYRTHGQYLSRWMSLKRDGLSEDYLQKYLKNIRKVSRKEVLDIVRKYYDPKKMFKIIVGPESLKLKKKTLLDVSHLSE